MNGIDLLIEELHIKTIGVARESFAVSMSGCGSSYSVVVPKFSVVMSPATIEIRFDPGTGSAMMDWYLLDGQKTIFFMADSSRVEIVWKDGDFIGDRKE